MRELGFKGLAGVSGLTLLLWPHLWFLDPMRLFSRSLDIQAFVLIELIAALVFLAARSGVGARRPVESITAAVLCSLALGIGVVLFRHFTGPDIFFIQATTRLLVISLLLAALTLYAASRAGGGHFAVLIAAVLALGYGAQFLDGPISAPPISASRYFVYLTFGSDGFFGRALQVISEIVVIFVLFGFVMTAVGANLAVGRIALLAARTGRGAAIKVSVIASALFGTISGSATSNVMTSGSFTISGMRRLGLTGAQAGGVEAVASTMGQLIPPIMGAAAFLMADFTGIPYLTIAASAALPAAIAIVILFLSADTLAAQAERSPAADAPLDDVAEPEALSRRDLWFLLPIFGMIVSLWFRPDLVERAGIVGAYLALLSGVARNGWRATMASIIALAASAAKSVAGLVVIGSSLGCIIAVLAATGLDTVLAIKIGQIGQDSLFLSLVLCAVAAIILGIGMATTGVYIIVAIMLAPGIVSLGVPKVAAHFFVLYCGAISMITPPVAFAVLAASGLTGAGFYRTAFEALRFGWILFLVPFLIVYFPGLVLVGSLMEIVVDVFTALAISLGVWGALRLLSRAVFRGSAVRE